MGVINLAPTNPVLLASVAANTNYIIYAAKKGNITAIFSQGNRKGLPWLSFGLFPVQRGLKRLPQFGDGFIICQRLRIDPAMLHSLPISMNGVRRQDMEKKWVDIPVSANGGIDILYNCASAQHLHLFALQLRLLANLRVSLFVWRHAWLDKAADASPMPLITADALAAPHDQQLRALWIVIVRAQQKARNHMRWAKTCLLLIRVRMVGISHGLVTPCHIQSFK
jgi:hypothetical protein